MGVFFVINLLFLFFKIDLLTIVFQIKEIDRKCYGNVIFRKTGEKPWIILRAI